MRWRFLDFQFDPFTRRVHGASVGRLGKRHAKVLEFLLKKRLTKEDYTNEEIVEFAWKEAKGSLDDLHHSIKRLRDIFGNDGDRESFIVSGPYKLVPEVQYIDDAVIRQSTGSALTALKPSQRSFKHNTGTDEREMCAMPTLGTDAEIDPPVQSPIIRAGLNELISIAGLSAFYPSRDYYARYRDAASIDQYVSTATRSVVLVSINLMTGIPIDGVCEMLIAKVRANAQFAATVSLLNPELPHLMASLAPVLGTTPSDLARSIRQSLTRLNDAKAQLRPRDRRRFSIRVHDTIPMGSAILIDHKEPFGRIQIESKIYKAPPRMSFAFEVVRTGSEGFYEALVKGYDDLVADGRIWKIISSRRRKQTRIGS